jgi:hypothetical protein
LCKLDRDISVRKLSRELQVNRATATLMVDRILNVSPEQAEILKNIIHAIE